MRRYFLGQVRENPRVSNTDRAKHFFNVLSDLPKTLYSDHITCIPAPMNSCDVYICLSLPVLTMHLQLPMLLLHVSEFHADLVEHLFPSCPALVFTVKLVMYQLNNLLWVHKRATLPDSITRNQSSINGKLGFAPLSLVAFNHMIPESSNLFANTALHLAVDHVTC